MTWNRPTTIKDSRQQLAQMVESPGFTLPLNSHGEPAPRSTLSRLLQGPFMMNGDLCDVMPGEEAVILESPSGERMLMQNEGRATFHVPQGWRLIVGSRPLRSEKMVQKLIKVGDQVREVESKQSILSLDNIEALYRETV